MVVETFLRRPEPVYERAAERGRMLPEDLHYLDSWVTEDLERCFQVMETDDPSLFAAWTAKWDDLVSFEIVPVVDSTEAAVRTTS